MRSMQLRISFAHRIPCDHHLDMKFVHYALSKNFEESAACRLKRGLCENEYANSGNEIRVFLM